jgi:bis(5'-nucleosyl)-tetraphosphatase (symmetrical)
MATYVIGDIHGCYAEFQRLLETIDFDPASDRIWHTGDLVNGGPCSETTLRWFMENEDVATTVLGNHDLHLVAVARGVQKKTPRDNFEDILGAADCTKLIDWLRRQPLLLREGDSLLVHAGLLPQWTIDQALDAAKEIEEILASSQPEQVLGVMYGNRPARWGDVKTTEERWRMIINAMTRMRVLRGDGGLDFTYKSTYSAIPGERMAWFDAEQPRWLGEQIYCGHWSALGLFRNDRVVALDTGCRWGGALTALRLEDQEIFQVEAGPIDD